MRRIEVDTDILQTHIEQLSAVLANTQAALKDLTERAESLRDMWTGPAHDKFDIQFELDRQRMENMCLIIRNVIDGTQQARIVYDQIEAEVDDAVSSIHV